MVMYKVYVNTVFAAPIGIGLRAVNAAGLVGTAIIPPTWEYLLKKEFDDVLALG